MFKKLLSLSLLIGFWSMNGFAVDQKLVNQSIFEVVTDKFNDYPQFDRPIDPQDIPFAIRNSTHNSIGTAFFVTNKILVSAAHVINIYSRSPSLGSYYIKDRNEKIHKIAQILSYDNERDIVAFTLQSYPEKIVPLKIKKSTKENVGIDTCAPGNAIGEGISYRCGGQLAAFTPEAVDGRWQNIRFSTPASPGNSGGPLLTKEGEVVGIIVRKSPNENLNVATPIQELLSLKGIHIGDPRHQMRETSGPITKSPIKLTYKAPQRLAPIWRKVQVDLEKELTKLYKKHRSEHAMSIFPLNKNIYRSIINGAAVTGTGYLATNDSQDWFFKQIEFQNVDIGDGKIMSIGSSPHGNATPLFVDLSADKPREILEALLKVSRVEYPIYGSNYRVLSPGDVHKTFNVKDGMGRKWRAHLWNNRVFEQSLLLFCSPVPKGSFCMMSSANLSSVSRTFLKMKLDGFNELVFPYVGNYKQWDEYLKTKDAPKFVKRAIKLDDMLLEARLKKSPIEVSAAGTIILVPNYKRKKGGLTLGIQKVAIYPDITKENEFVSIGLLYSPGEGSEEKMKEFYKLVSNESFPFNGDLVKQESIFQSYFPKDISKRSSVLMICTSPNKDFIEEHCED